MNKLWIKAVNLLVLIVLSSSMHAKKTCANFKICPEPESCITVQTRLDQIQQELSACCSSLNFRCNVIRGCLANCDQSIPIDQDFMDTATPQITQSGVYCLVESVTGELIIDADNVTINMNDFVLTASVNGISSVNTHNNISVLGGGVLQNATGT